MNRIYDVHLIMIYPYPKLMCVCVWGGGGVHKSVHVCVKVPCVLPYCRGDM